MAFTRQIKKSWYWLLIPLAIMLLGPILHYTGAYKNWWILITGFIGGIGYIAFWYIQFYAATQMEQNAQMFDKFAYEIDSRQIMVKVNKKEGGVIKWDTIQSAEKLENEEGFLLNIARGQFLHFPKKVFNSDHDIRLLENILRRKSLID